MIERQPGKNTNKHKRNIAKHSATRIDKTTTKNTGRGKTNKWPTNTRETRTMKNK